MREEDRIAAVEKHESLPDSLFGLQFANDFLQTIVSKYYIRLN